MILPGVPSAEQVSGGLRFLDLPVLTSGQDLGTTPSPLRSRLEFLVFDAEATVYLRLGAEQVHVIGANQFADWTIEAASSTTSITVPEAPSGVNLRTHFGSDVVWAVLGVAEPNALGFADRDASLAPFSLSLP